jgi:hypothetical protein
VLANALQEQVIECVGGETLETVIAEMKRFRSGRKREALTLGQHAPRRALLRAANRFSNQRKGKLK